MIQVPGHPMWHITIFLGGGSPGSPVSLFYKLVLPGSWGALVTSWSREGGWGESTLKDTLTQVRTMGWSGIPEYLEDGLAEDAMAVVLATDPAALFIAMEVMGA